MLSLALFISSGRVYAESASRNITVLINVESPLTLLIDTKDITVKSKSATVPEGKNYTRQAENNTILYTVTE